MFSAKTRVGKRVCFVRDNGKDSRNVPTACVGRLVFRRENVLFRTADFVRNRYGGFVGKGYLDPYCWVLVIIVQQFRS